MCFHISDNIFERMNVSLKISRIQQLFERFHFLLYQFHHFVKGTTVFLQNIQSQSFPRSNFFCSSTSETKCVLRARPRNVLPIMETVIAENKNPHRKVFLSAKRRHCCKFTTGHRAFLFFRAPTHFLCKEFKFRSCLSQ